MKLQVCGVIVLAEWLWCLIHNEELGDRCGLWGCKNRSRCSSCPNVV